MKLATCVRFLLGFNFKFLKYYIFVFSSSIFLALALALALVKRSNLLLILFKLLSLLLNCIENKFDLFFI